MTRFGYPASTPAVQAPPAGPVTESGTYTPSSGIISGLQVGLVASLTQWMRVGDIVTVAGRLDGTALGNSPVQFTVAVPVVPNPVFQVPTRLNGVVTARNTVTGATISGIVYARVIGAATQAQCDLENTTADLFNYYYVYTYSLT
jgi:hypothetical protein